MLSKDLLTKLYVEITTHCNLDCVMCVRRAWHEPKDNMPAKTFGRLVEQLVSMPEPPTIHLGGYGEPMVHPEFLSMVATGKAAGVRVEVTTNGMLLDKAMAAALVDLKLDRLVVSIDAVSPPAFGAVRTNGNLTQVLNNMLWLRRLKLRRWGQHGPPQTGLAFVAMKSNIDDLPALPMLASRLGASEILISNLVPHTAAMEGEILYQRSLTNCAYRASRWVSTMSLPKLDLTERTALPLIKAFNTTASISLLDASLSDRNDYCPFANQGYAAVRWDGTVSPCLMLLHDHPEYIRGRRKDVTHHTVGNVNETPLPELWRSTTFTDFRRRLRDFSFSPCTTCGGCERFPANFEDCTGNGFPTCGGCLWAQGFVQCP